MKASESPGTTRPDEEAEGRDRPWLHVMLSFTMVAIFAYALWSPYAQGWPTTARTFAIAVGWVGLPSSVLVFGGQLLTVIRHRRERADRSWPSLGPKGPPLIPVLRHWTWMIAYVVLIRQIGFLPATFGFIIVYLLVEARRTPHVAAAYAMVMVGAMMVVFGTLFGLPWPRGNFNGVQNWILEAYWRIGG